jgi:hypothetical protein
MWLLGLAAGYASLLMLAAVWAIVSRTRQAILERKQGSRSSRLSGTRPTS